MTVDLNWTLGYLANECKHLLRLMCVWERETRRRRTQWRFMSDHCPPETTTLTLGHHLTDQDLFCLSSIKPPWPVGTSASIPYMFEPVMYNPHYHLLSFEAARPSNTFVMLLTDLFLLFRCSIVISWHKSHCGSKLCELLLDGSPGSGTEYLPLIKPKHFLCTHCTTDYYTY